MDNTVGSLSQLQKSVIIGSILGDGYIRILSGRNNAFLEINHSFKAKEYVDWKYFVLKNICQSSPKKRMIDGKRIAYRFFSKQYPKITNLWKLFYKNGRKIIPKKFKLNPIILAVWFMDDGSKCRNQDIYLNCQQFAIKDQKELLSALRKMGLKARLNRDKKYYRIRFLKESIERLNKIIYPFVVPSMKYKLSMTL